MPSNDKICPYCKTRQSEFTSSGLVGCEHCYETFREIICRWTQKNQISGNHIGKRALTALSGELFNRYTLLTEMLDEAVYAEDYASILRIKAEMDEIRKGQ